MTSGTAVNPLVDPGDATRPRQYQWQIWEVHLPDNVPFIRHRDLFKETLVPKITKENPLPPANIHCQVLVVTRVQGISRRQDAVQIAIYCLPYIIIPQAAIS